jgi:Mn-dependent DtxR family transcriptional regulator
MILLHVLPIRVMSLEGKSLTTYALLDNASRGTILSSDVAKRLNIDGPTQSVALTTLHGKRDREFKEVKFQLQSADPTEESPILTVSSGLVRENSAA